MKHFWVYAERNRWYVGKFLVEAITEDAAKQLFGNLHPHLTVAWVR